jgi:hypothetical protein
MTFLELPDLDTTELALELFYAGDAPDLDAAAALAFDLRVALIDFAYDWDFDVTTQAIAANDWTTIIAAHTLPLL